MSKEPDATVVSKEPGKPVVAKDPDAHHKRPKLEDVRIEPPADDIKDSYNRHKLWRKTGGMVGEQLDLRGKDLSGALVDEHTILPDMPNKGRHKESLEQSRLEHKPYRYNR